MLLNESQMEVVISGQLQVNRQLDALEEFGFMWVCVFVCVTCWKRICCSCKR